MDSRMMRLADRKLFKLAVGMRIQILLSAST
jgi:hypothetical protein